MEVTVLNNFNHNPLIMEVKETIEGDKLIYAFMEGKWQPIEEGYTSAGFCSLDKKFKSEIACQKFCDKENKHRKPGNLLIPLPIPKGTNFKFTYRTKWDSIMPVVQKIESFSLLFQIQGHSSCITWLGGGADEIEWLERFPSQGLFTDDDQEMSKIESVWRVIVMFVKWYNSQTNQITL